MGLMPFMRLRQVLRKRKPFSHNLTPLKYFKNDGINRRFKTYKNVSIDKMVSIEDRLVIDNTELLTYYHHAIFMD
jgi:hypothetical protein